MIVSGEPPSPAASRIATELRALDLDVSWSFESTSAQTDLILSRILGEEPNLKALLDRQSYIEESNPLAKVVNRSHAVERALSKFFQSNAFQAAGILHPSTYLFQPGDSSSRLLSESSLPLVVKPDIGLMGRGVRLLDSRAAVTEFLRDRPEVDQVIQPFFAEARETFRLITTRNSPIAGCSRRARDREWRANAALGATVAPHTFTIAEWDVAARAVEALDLDLGGVDLVRTAEGPLVLEVNASPGLTGIESVCGNVAKLICEAILD